MSPTAISSPANTLASHPSAGDELAALGWEIQTSTAAEWVRGGHALGYLPLVDAAFAAHEISYAKVRILTRWADDDWVFPSYGQQRADAFVALFLGCDISLTTEVVVHVRGNGITFDDGTPTTSNAVVRQLDDSFIRLLIHDTERRPINASSRRRHPTTRQKRVVMETHRHECIDCQSTDLLELDHNPSFEQTHRTVTHELEPRCSPCHRHDSAGVQHRAA